MKRSILIAAMITTLTGCDQLSLYRDSPAAQVEDYKICLEGGLDASRTTYGEITCIIPNFETTLADDARQSGVQIDE